jgi:SARP family transcriptional regulator, regulator of embCAB operon
VYLTGALCVEAGERVLFEDDLPGPQGRALLGMLAAEYRRALSRAELAEQLWGPRLPRAWEGSLKALVSKLRSSLSSAGLPGGELVGSAFGTYQFRLPAHSFVDVDAAAAAIHLAEAALARRELEHAAGEALVTRLITARPFLPGMEGDWAEAWRARLRELRIRAMECMAAVDLERGRATEAVRSCELALELDPLRESSRRALMRAHATAANVGKALSAYERCRATLGEELGALPSAATRAVHEELLQALC